MARAETMNAKYLGFLIIGLSLGTALPLPAANLPSFNLTVKDGRFSPDKLEIPAGQKIQLVIKNEGPGPEEFESSDLNREKLVNAGGTVQVIIGPLGAGRYGFYGEFHPQTALGQIIVQ